MCDKDDGKRRYRNYQFRIQTSDGGLLNTTQNGWDMMNAQYRLLKRYPRATIIEQHEK